MQVALAIGEHAWPVALLVTVLLLLRIRVVRTAVWDRLLWCIGVSKTQRCQLATDAAKRDLGIRDPPAT